MEEATAPDRTTLTGAPDPARVRRWRAMSETVQLICEGRCNAPWIGEADRQIAKRVREINGPVQAGEALHDLLARLKHTAHEVVFSAQHGTFRPRCVACRTSRQWGT